MLYKVDFRLFDETFLVNQLHECVQQVVLNLLFYEWFVHVFHEV